MEASTTARKDTRYVNSDRFWVVMDMCDLRLTTYDHQSGISHAFISEFENEEDRKYYLHKDPAHLDFIKSVAGIVAKGQVIDFTPGAF